MIPHSQKIRVFWTPTTPSLAYVTQNCLQAIIRASHYRYRTMSSSKVPLFICENPFCPKANKAFSNRAAYTLHMDKSPTCFSFIVKQKEGGVPHGISSDCQHRIHEDGDVTWTSTKRPKLLRRQVVDITTAQQSGVFSDVHENFPPTSGTRAGNAGNAGSGEFPQPPDCSPSVANVGDSHDGSNDDSVGVGTDFECDDAVIYNDDDVYESPPTIPTDGYAEAPSFHSHFMYTTDQKWTVALLKILDEMNAPDYAFGSIMAWARSASADSYSFYPAGGLSRSKNVDSLIASVHNGRHILPFVTTVQVPHGPPSDVICFDFVSQLLSLLQNRTVMTAENLVIDINNPLQPYASPDNILSEALSGSVYREAYDRLITDPSKQFFVPIIQWIDRTSVTGNDRFSLKPYMFTPAIFTEKFRRSIKAWGFHGFLPKNKTSSAQNQVKQQGDNVRNYHAELRAVLASFRDATSHLRGVVLPIGPTGSLRVDIVTCLLFVIQDMQEGDMLCGRFGPHSPQINRHCRSCDVAYEDLDNRFVKCSYLQALDMALIAFDDDDDHRAVWSQHKLDNAFDDIVFADPARGIFGATPVETMHSFRKGIIENVTLFVLANVPPSKKASLDHLAIAFHKSHRQTYRKAYPSTDFSNGITNLTKISASERLGLVFLFVILFQYDEGWQIIQSSLLGRTEKKLPEIVQTFEALLCFDAWVNQSHFWKTSDSVGRAAAMATATESIQELMKMCRKNIPTSKPNAWKFPKFHEMLHIVDDMSRFGSPVNYCAQRPESLLIPAAKQPGRRAQKRHVGSAYELQSAQRLAYSFMIETVYSRIWDDPTVSRNMDEIDNSNVDDIEQSTGQATFGSVSRVQKNGEKCGYHVSWKTRTHMDVMKLPPKLLEFLCDEFKETATVRFCTEYKREDHTFRCHPCYQSDGPIYDWMKIDFGPGRNGGVLPCRLAAVVLVESPKDPNEKFQLVVQSVSKKTGVQSALLTEWYWSSTYYAVSPNTIVAPCFVISITQDGSKVLEALPYEDWPDQYTKCSIPAT